MSVLTREIAVEFIRIGHKLENGATVVDFTWDQRSFDGSVHPGGYVLAILPWSPDKYVTWGFAVQEDGRVACFSGHYFDRLQAALDDFNRRSK